MTWRKETNKIKNKKHFISCFCCCKGLVSFWFSLLKTLSKRFKNWQLKLFFFSRTMIDNDDVENIFIRIFLNPCIANYKKIKQNIDRYRNKSPTRFVHSSTLPTYLPSRQNQSFVPIVYFYLAVNSSVIFLFNYF